MLSGVLLDVTLLGGGREGGVVGWRKICAQKKKKKETSL